MTLTTMFVVLVILLLVIVVLLCTKQENRPNVITYLIGTVIGIFLIVYVVPVVAAFVWESGILQSKWVKIAGIMVGWVIVVSIGRALFEAFEKKQKEDNQRVRQLAKNKSDLPS